MGVMGDLRWLRLLEPGGAVCFHDYSRTMKGVYLPVTRLLARHRNYERIGQAGSLLALRKTGSSVAAEVDISDWLYACLKYVPLQIERKIAKWTHAPEAMAE